MEALMRLWKRFTDWLTGRADRDLDRELRSHIDLEAEEHQEAGIPPDEARYAARRAFGNVTRLREDTRSMWGWMSFERLAQDLRYACRTLSKNRAFAAAVVGTLGLGIGANTAMFSVVNAVLVRPLPFEEPDQLFLITGYSLRQQASLVAFQNQDPSAEYAAYSSGNQLNLTGEGDPVRLTGSVVSANLFSVLKAQPFLGRVFEAGEDTPGRDAVVVLSHSYWQARFRGDPGILGRFITLDETVRRVVGVMPPQFRFPTPQTQLWIPTRIDPANVGVYWWTNNLNLVGRLSPGRTLSEVEAAVDRLRPRIRDGFPWQMWPDWGSDAQVAGLQEALVGDVKTRLLVLLAAVGLVLLIACANVGNLLLARGASRQKEIALRASLGASRGRIVRQLLTESLVLGLAGGTAGFALALLTSGMLGYLLPPDLPRLSEIGIDLRVLAFTAALVLGTGFGFGVLPALRLSRANTQSSLKAAGRTVVCGRNRQRLSATIVVLEIAVGVVVVISAGLVARSLWLLTSVHPGFDTANLLTAVVTPNESLCREPSRCAAFYDELLGKLRSLPGVLAAAAVNPLPLGGGIGGTPAEMEDHPHVPGTPSPTLWMANVTPEYLRVMRIPILQGRSFESTDQQGRVDVALVSRSTVERWWPGQNPIGKQLHLVGGKQRWRTVVGVTGNTLQETLAGNPDWQDGEIYLPYAQNVRPQMTVVVRTSREPNDVAVPLRQIVAEMRPDVPVTEVRTMEEVVSASLITPRSTMWLLSTFAGLALLLSATGIYAVVSYATVQRTREFGIRMALGARPADIRRRVLAHSLALGCAGLALGVAAAFGATRVLASFLFDITTTDLVTFASMPLLLLMVVLMASFVPAYRASGVDPTVALRSE
jgi:putative ABC transport system permease protein